ncbi:MAG: hypothetical protein ACYTJ0_09375 [Planctomycetota bacterium]|jgi:hypothetical protein
MGRLHDRRRGRCARGLAAALLLAGSGGHAPASGTDGGSPLRRLVRHFDFEDAELVPMDMPRHMRRVDERRALGEVLFGRIRLTDERALAGRWSLGFELDGSSLVAEVVSGVLPVMPGSDYQVTVAVRTEQLRHARARLSAWLHHARTDRPVAGSRVESDAIRSEGRWRTLSVQVPAAGDEPADLIVELELLQPRDRLGPTGEPRFADIGGRAFFDDLAIWLVPRIELTTDAPGNVFVAPQRPRIDVRIADLMESAPPAALRVTDAEGRTVLERQLAGRGRLRTEQVELPALPLGWYRVEVEIPGIGPVDGGLGRTALDLVVAASPAAASVGAPHLGVLLPRPAAPAADLLALLGTRGTIATVDARAGDGPPDAPSSGPHADTAAIAAIAARGPGLVLEVHPAAAEPTAALARRLAIQLGPRITGWQLGRAEAIAAAPFPAVLPEATAASLGLSSEGGRTLVPWPAERPIEPPPGRQANIIVPHHLRPAAVGDLLAEWPAPRTVTLLGPPRGLYGARDHVADLIARTLQAWRVGVDTLYLEAPWDHGARGTAPDATFVAVQQLARHLQGRRFVGELTLGEGIEAWLLEPVGAGPAALVAWCDAGERRASVVLGGDQLQAVDAFGNPRPLPVDGDRRELHLTPLPQFVEGVDRELARFRVAFSLEPPDLPTEARVHRRELRLTNPWNVPVSGTVYLEEGDQWQATPRANPFTIAPHETIGLPLTLVPSRSMIAGPRVLRAEIELTASRPYRFRASAPLEAGLPDLELLESWRRVTDPATGREDVVVRLDVRNTSDRPMSLVAFVQAPGAGLQRQPIGRLDPGTVATRTFTLADGGARLAGGSLYVGVDEHDRSRRLTHEIRIP